MNLKPPPHRPPLPLPRAIDPHGRPPPNAPAPGTVAYLQRKISPHLTAEQVARLDAMLEEARQRNPPR